MLSINEIKKQASILKDFLSNINTSIKRTSCLEAIARINGYNGWNIMSANLKKPEMMHEQRNLTNADDSVRLSKIALSALIKLDNNIKLDDDSSQMLFTILLNLREDSFIVNEISYLSLSAYWSQERFNITLSKLVNIQFIHLNNTNNGKLQITINPLHFWKGAEHNRASEIVKFIAYLKSEKIDKQPNIKIRKAGTTPYNENDIIAFAKDRNKSKYYEKAVPVLRFENDILPENHPKIVKLQDYLNTQKPLADPRVFLKEVTEIVGYEYYVGHGGAHIHIKTFDMTDCIAIITAGI